MWIRYNSTLKYYEYSNDNGGAWAQLPLSASAITEGTFPNVAYTNAVNTFTQVNIFTQDIYIQTVWYPSLVLRNTALGTDKKNWWIRNTNAETFAIQAINDANTVVLSEALALSRVGDATVAGTLSTNSNLALRSTTGTVTIQNDASYLRIHAPTYGQVSYMDYAGNWAFSGLLNCYQVHCGSHIYTAGRLYTAGRTAYEGQRRTDWTPALYNAGGTNIGGSIAARYSIIGDMCFWWIYAVNFNTPVATAYIDVYPLPIAMVEPNYPHGAFRAYLPGIGDRYGFFETIGDRLRFSSPTGSGGTGQWGAGVGHVLAQGFYPIA